MIVGVGFFGTFTAYIASLFLSGSKPNQNADSELLKEIRLLRERLEGLDAKLSGTTVKLPAQFGSTSQPKE